MRLDIASSGSLKPAHVTTLADWGFTRRWTVTAGRTGDPISALTDQITGSLDLVQATSGNRPDYQAGPPEIAAFDGSNDFIEAAGTGITPGGASPVTLLVYVNTTGASGSRSVFCVGSQSGFGLRQITYDASATKFHALRLADFLASAEPIQPTGQSAGIYTVIAQFDPPSGNTSLWVSSDPSTITSVASSGSLTASDVYITLGAQHNAGSGGAAANFWNGSILECAMAPLVGLSASDMQDIDAYLASVH